MLKITVPKAVVSEIPYTDKKGQPAKLLKQVAYLHTVEEDGAPSFAPARFEVLLPKGVTTPYPAGEYNLHPSAIGIDQNGRLSCTPRLTPIKRAA